MDENITLDEIGNKGFGIMVYILCKVLISVRLRIDTPRIVV